MGIGITAISALDVQLQLYTHLRNEIIQSINNQHRTFIAESFFVSIVFSFSLIGTLIIKSVPGADIYVSNHAAMEIISTVLAFVIAPAVIFLTSLWLIEQSRMMRAGEFLERLEDEINIELDGSYLIWENWLRRGDVKFLDVHRMHHWAQTIIIGMFLLMGYLSIFLINYLRPSYKDYDLLFIAFIVGCFALLTFLCCIYLWSIFHRHEKKDKLNPGNKTCFDRFRADYEKNQRFKFNSEKIQKYSSGSSVKGEE